MSRITTEAENFIEELLFNPSIPSTIKNGVITNLQSASTRQTALRSSIAIVKDGTKTVAQRLAALKIVIDYAKGDA